MKIKKNRRKVPVLRDSEIDAYAEELLKKYEPQILSEPQALNIEDFAEFHMGFNIHYTHLSHNGFIWGKMVFQDSLILNYDPATGRAGEEPVEANTIVIDNRLIDKEHAFRSTVAHETAHGIFHPEYYFHNYNPRQVLFSFVDDEEYHSSICSTFCRDKNIKADVNTHRKFETDIEWIEHQAKYFSAAILMPKTAVYMLLDDHKTQNPWDDNAFVKIISEIFNVSVASAKIRIKTLHTAYLTYLTEKQSINLFS